MKVIIAEGIPKEIAVLVLDIQGRQVYTEVYAYSGEGPECGNE